VTAPRQRIDKWLWHARVVKTRTLAQRLVEQGYVRLNGTRIQIASQTVKMGDVLTIALDERVKVLEVRDFAEARGSAPLAQRLYTDRSPPPVPRPERPPTGLVRDAGSGRPTKRDRREIDRIKGRDG
jgi:ribosome-associated heat shock protein Hsp15